MRPLVLLVILVSFLLLGACSDTGAKRTYGKYSNWHAMQDRGGSR